MIRYLKISALLLGAALLGWFLGGCTPVDATASEDLLPARRITVEYEQVEGIGIWIVADSLNGITCYRATTGMSCLYTGTPAEEGAE